MADTQTVTPSEWDAQGNPVQANAASVHEWDASGNPVSQAGGLLTKGNIDLYNRHKIPNPRGGTSTVYSMSFEENGKEILVPKAADGRILSDKEAIERYHKTGEHLGIFK